MSFRIARKIVGFIIGHIFFRLKIHGRENMPAEGAVIIAMNHRSYWDGPLAATTLPRQLAIMAKKELFDVPVLSAILRWAGAFPVSRGQGDISAIKAALKALKAGMAMAIFPEGRRVFKGQEHTAKAGVALIAEKTGAPIVPVAISGKYLPFARVNVYIEKPIYVKNENGEKLTGEQLQEVSDYLMQKILHMAGYSDTPAVKENVTLWISE